MNRAMIETSDKFSYELVNMLAVMDTAAELLSKFFQSLSLQTALDEESSWRNFFIGLLEESTNQIEAPNGLADIFIETARNSILQKQITLLSRAQKSPENQTCVVYYDNDAFYFDRSAFEQICLECGCSPSAVKHELQDLGYLEGSLANSNSMQTRILIRISNSKPKIMRVYKISREKFERLGDPPII